MTPLQQASVGLSFCDFARAARETGCADQDLAEWMLDLSVRWLAAHGIAPTNLHLWVNHALERARPSPLTAAARAPNDFGGRK